MKIENFIKLDLKKKIAISIIFFLTVIFSVVFFIVMPALKDIKIIKNNIEEQRMELERKYLKGQSLRGVSKRIEKVEEKMYNIDNIFVNRKEGLEFITSLEKLAEKNNINQKINIKLSDEPFENKFKKIPIQLFTNGRLNNQVNYLVGLETMGYYININSIEISSYSSETIEGDSNNLDFISLLLTADTYWKQ